MRGRDWGSDSLGGSRPPFSFTGGAGECLGLALRRVSVGALYPGLIGRRFVGELDMAKNLTEERVRRKLSQYLVRKVSLRALNDWLVESTWDLGQQADKSLRTLVYGIKLRLAEYTSGVWTEDQLREKLEPFATTFELSFMAALENLQSVAVVGGPPYGRPRNIFSEREGRMSALTSPETSTTPC